MEDKDMYLLKQMREATLSIAIGFEKLSSLCGTDLYKTKFCSCPFATQINELASYYSNKFDELESDILTSEITEQLINLDADIEVRLEVYRRVYKNLVEEYGEF